MSLISVIVYKHFRYTNPNNTIKFSMIHHCTSILVSTAHILYYAALPRSDPFQTENHKIAFLGENGKTLNWYQSCNNPQICLTQAAADEET